MKGILTKEHISKIEKEALNPVYRMEGVISFGLGTKSPFTIMRVTPKGLIFINGTEDTGFDHIHQRHSGNTHKEYWDNYYDHKGEVVEKKDILGRTKLKLDNPSSFHPHSIPIHDFLSIAEQIYNFENLNIEKNKNKELFDVFDGIAKGLDEIETKYRLITYKDSKIVHTLIPLTKKFNKQEKVDIDFFRQRPKTSLKLINDDYQIEIPYKDEYYVIRYIIIIREDTQDKKMECWYIQINSPYGTPIVTEFQGKREKDSDFRSDEFLWKLENTNFSILEKRIKQIEEQLKPIED